MKMADIDFMMLKRVSTGPYIPQRVREDGCPMAVQYWKYDRFFYRFEVVLFDGSHIILPEELVKDWCNNYSKWDDESISMAVDGFMEKYIPIYMKTRNPCRGYK
jgi:hypothetical protein